MYPDTCLVITTKHINFRRFVMVKREILNAYWMENKRLMMVTLFIWSIVSYGATLIAGSLNNIVIFGFPLGYYMGAQGSLIVFVILNIIYSSKMNQIDKKYELHEEE